MEKIAILGGGNGAHACAADLSLAGYKVNLYELPKFVESIRPTIERGGIDIFGVAREGFAKLSKATTNINEAIEGVDLILIIVPAFAQKVFAETCLPYLENGQIVIYLGKGGGSLDFSKTKKILEINKDIVVGETNTLPYGCRLVGPAKVNVFQKVKELRVAAFPAKNNPIVTEALKEIYPSVISVTNVLETILNDINAVLHPAPVILNAGRIESSKGEFYIYKEGVTPSVVGVLKAVDDERLALLKVLNLEQIPFEELFFRTGFGPKGTMEETIVKSGADSVKVPSLKYRYIAEDVPYGLVPMASLGDLLGVHTPVIDSLITIASVINQVDYFKDGRNVEKMGLTGLSLSNLIDYLNFGYAA
jgi:opine dehydrogenase